MDKFSVRVYVQVFYNCNPFALACGYNHGDKLELIARNEMEMSESLLEDIFLASNDDTRPRNLRSMSVGDIVTIDYPDYTRKIYVFCEVGVKGIDTTNLRYHVAENRVTLSVIDNNDIEEDI